LLSRCHQKCNRPGGSYSHIAGRFSDLRQFDRGAGDKIATPACDWRAGWNIWTDLSAHRIFRRRHTKNRNESEEWIHPRPTRFEEAQDKTRFALADAAQ